MEPPARIERATSEIPTLRSGQLSYGGKMERATRIELAMSSLEGKRSAIGAGPAIELAPSAGFEPATSSFEAKHSESRLSYEGKEIGVLYRI